MGPLLFVYGTLCRKSEHAIARRFHQQARFVSEAWLAGQLYDAGGYPALVEEEACAAWVKGELYHLPYAMKTLALLDAYEESSPQFPAPQEYARVQSFALDTAWQVHTCWVYVYQWSIADFSHLPSGEWLG